MSTHEFNSRFIPRNGTDGERRSFLQLAGLGNLQRAAAGREFRRCSECLIQCRSEGHRASLNRVRDNVAAFGGDPNRVMIFGSLAAARSRMPHPGMP